MRGRGAGVQSWELLPSAFRPLHWATKLGSQPSPTLSLPGEHPSLPGQGLLFLGKEIWW